MLHPDLQKLLELALADGEMTEKERQILHNKAKTLGQDIDELDMIIEGELHKFKKQNDGEKQSNYECPNCGSSISKTSIKCKFCGFELSKSKITGSDAIEKLNQQFEIINKRQAEAELADKWGLKSDGINAARQKASAIATFAMPNDKEHLIEFFHFCDSNYDSHSDTSMFANANYNVNKILGPAWASKAKLTYNKLSKFANEDIEIRTLIDTYKNKYYEDSSQVKAASINTNSYTASKAVFLGLNKNGVILFVVLLLLCFPLAWLPWVISSTKANG